MLSNSNFKAFHSAEKSTYPFATRAATSIPLYRADFTCYGEEVIVELKALSQISGKDEAQILNYLKATESEVGLLLNFGERSLVHKRFVFTRRD